MVSFIAMGITVFHYCDANGGHWQFWEKEERWRGSRLLLSFSAFGHDIVFEIAKERELPSMDELLDTLEPLADAAVAQMISIAAQRAQRAQTLDNGFKGFDA